MRLRRVMFTASLSSSHLLITLAAEIFYLEAFFLSIVLSLLVSTRIFIKCYWFT